MIHQYKNNGYNIVLDVNSGGVHVVDKMVYDLIGLLNPPLSEEMPAEIAKVLSDYHEAELRECYEETGLTLTEYKYCGIVTFVSNEWENEYMHLFLGLDYKGEIKECDEGNLEWIYKEKVLSLPIWVGDKIFFKLIADHNRPFFSLKLVYEGEKLVEAVLDGKQISAEVV